MGENDAEDRSRNSGRHESLRLDEALKQRLEGLVPEVIKRTFYAGLGAVFTTEEGIRRLANEFSLPKEVASYLRKSLSWVYKNLFRIVATELRGFLESLNLNEELQRLLTSLSFEIKTEIRFIPNDAKLIKPKIKNRVTVKRRSDEEQGQEQPEAPAEAEEEG